MDFGYPAEITSAGRPFVERPRPVLCNAEWFAGLCGQPRPERLSVNRRPSISSELRS